VKKMATPSEYLAKPYGRNVVPEPDGSFRAEIIEFPGCIAAGDTAAEALARLEDVAESWLEAVLEKKQRIPEPIESTAFSGKLVLRLARSLHKQAAHAAARDGVSLNYFIANCVAQQVSHRSSGLTYAYLQPAPKQQAAVFTVQVGNFYQLGNPAVLEISGTQATRIPMPSAMKDDYARG
jgi:predicted RNase H-like HicB family nuclease